MSESEKEAVAEQVLEAAEKLYLDIMDMIASPEVATRLPPGGASTAAILTALMMTIGCVDGMATPYPPHPNASRMQAMLEYPYNQGFAVGVKHRKDTKHVSH